MLARVLTKSPLDRYASGKTVENRKQTSPLDAALNSLFKMLISDLNNRDEVLAAVIKELSSMGIKVRNEKRQKHTVVSRKSFCS